LSRGQIALYFAWSRPDETGAALGILENRFASLFELRRIQFPKLEQLKDPRRYDQGIAGFLDHILLVNYEMFCAQSLAVTGQAVRTAQRRTQESGDTLLDSAFLSGIDTLIVISFDSTRTGQRATPAELVAVRAFLADPKHSLFVCPHHDLGAVGGLPAQEQLAAQEVEFQHHGDRASPAQQRFGGFGVSLLEGLEVPVRNRFGLRPGRSADGSPAPVEINASADRSGLLDGVTTFHLHPHLPHFEPVGNSVAKFDVLVRQLIDLDAPPHPFVQAGRNTFDALLQAKAGIFAGRLVVCDATIWSSTFGGVESLKRFWHNVAAPTPPQGGSV
jgi:hypothetical protein